MTSIPKIEYVSAESLYLDTQNPRLGREMRKTNPSQEKLLDWLKSWSLDEIAESFLVSGFWPQEPLIVVKEKIGKNYQHVVVEGNRRLATLKWMRRAIDGDENAPSRLKKAVRAENIPDALFQEVPCIVVPNRGAVSAYLGYRHVTGIKEWNPAEKAEFIAARIEVDHLGYEEIRRRIGSRMSTVRQHYIAFNVFRHIEDVAEESDFDPKNVEEKFSVLYRALSNEDVRSFLGISLELSPAAARKPIPKSKEKNLARFAKWVFGARDNPPLFTDSRNIDRFGRILASAEALQYLEETELPNFEIAYGVTEDSSKDLTIALRRARAHIQDVIGQLYLHRDDRALRGEIRLLLAATREIANSAGGGIAKEFGQRADA